MMSKLFVIFVSFFVNVIIIIVLKIRSRNWFLKTNIPKSGFDKYHNYTIRDVPIRYYDKLDESLTELPGGLSLTSNGTFYVLRTRSTHKNDTFDWDIFKDVSVGFKKIRDKCLYPESIVCPVCFENPIIYPDDPKLASLNIFNEIFNEKGYSNYYSSFSYINITKIKSIFRSMNFGFSHEKIKLEHAFISNFKEGRVSASIHGSAMVSSMAVQFVGSKTWIFFSPQVYVDQMNSLPGSSATNPTQSPKEKYDVYIYKSQPGDVLFFSENWGHGVWTSPGPNFMLTFRHLQIGNVLRRPILWFHSFMNMFWYDDRNIHLEHINKKKSWVELFYGKKYTIQPEYRKKISSLCSHTEGNSEWDEEMLKILKSHSN